MKNWTALGVFIAASGALAQTGSDVERERISAERSRLEATFTREDSACYKRFLVNNCLAEVKIRRRDALADLRRQEIVLNDEARKAKGAEQLQKIEEKSSPEKLQLEADKKAQALKDFADTMARDKQKNADRIALQAEEKANAEAAASRVKNNQDKQVRATSKQAATTEERRKYNERQAQAKERQARYARDKADQTKTPAQPLPVPP